MNRVAKLVFALVGLLVATVCGQNQHLGEDQWPTPYRDPANTVSTTVDLGGDVNELLLGALCVEHRFLQKTLEIQGH